MGNISGCCYVRGGTLDTCHCCDVWQRSFVAPVGIFLWRWLRFILWCIVQLIDLISTLFILGWELLKGLWLGPLFWFIVALLVSWVFWFAYPTVAPYIGTIAIPLINLALELLVFAWYLFVVLWNLFARVWNAFAPITGMLLYIAMEVLITVLTEVVKILGEVPLQALMKPLMEILNVLSKILVAVIQVIVAVGKPVLQLLEKLIGPILHIFFSVLSLYIKIYTWLVTKLFRLLEPVLGVVLAIVRAFRHTSFAFRSLLSLDDYSSEDDSDRAMFADVRPSAEKYWGDSSVAQSNIQELSDINAYLDHHGPLSSGFYYTVMRPYASANSDSWTEISREIVRADSEAEAYEGSRRLLALGSSRGLLTLEERELFDRPAVDFEEFWERFAEDPGAAHEWYQQEHAKVNKKKEQVFSRVVRKLAETGELNNNSTLPRKTRHADPWRGHLHKKLKCKSNACGGHGKPLDHPIVTLRKRHWEREEIPREEIPWREPDETQEEYERRSYVYLASLTTAFQTAHEQVIDKHIRDPRLWKHAHEGFKRATGYETFHDAFNDFHDQYADGSHFLYDTLCGMTDWGPLRMMKEADPERHSRAYCSDFSKTVEVQIRPHPTKPGRKLAEFVLEPEVRQDHRALLETVLEDIDHPARRELLSIALDQEWSRWLSDTTKRNLLSASMRHPLADVFGIELPNPIGNASGINADLKDRRDRVESKKPIPKARLPLFELLSLDCYTTSPRNPLCLPEIPSSWIIRKTPQVKWPENATGDDSFCAPLYCLPPRDLLDWRAWISWCWIMNGITSYKLILSQLFVIFTDSIGFLKDNYSWVSWLLSPILALPPGATPTDLDWLCFAIHFYGMVLVAFLVWVFFVVIVPIVSWIFRVAARFVAFYETFVMADELRRERLKDTGRLFYNFAYDSDMNPGVRYFNDPNYFNRSLTGQRRPMTFDFNNHDRSVPRPQFGDYDSAVNQWAPSAGRYHRSSFMPWQGQTAYERYNAVTPYHMTQEGGFRLPWNTTTEQLGDTSLIGDALQDAHWPPSLTLDERLAMDTARADNTQGKSGGDQQEQQRRLEEESRQRARELEQQRRERLEALAELAQLERALYDATYLFGTWRYEVTSNVLVRFEAIFNWLLHSHYMTFWWSMQYAYAEAKKRKIQLWYSPVMGEYRRGFTVHTQDDLSRTLYPNNVPSFRRQEPRNMSV